VLLTNRSYERPNRPYPLDRLRSDLLRTVTGTVTGLNSDAWLQPRTTPSRGS